MSNCNGRQNQCGICTQSLITSETNFLRVCFSLVRVKWLIRITFSDTNQIHHSNEEIPKWIPFELMCYGNPPSSPLGLLLSSPLPPPRRLTIPVLRTLIDPSWPSNLPRTLALCCLEELRKKLLFRSFSYSFFGAWLWGRRQLLLMLLLTKDIFLTPPLSFLNKNVAVSWCC